MSCPSCDLYLQYLLDGDEAVLGEADALAHISECPTCRELQVAANLLLEGLRRFPKPVPPPDLNQRITAAVLADRRHRLTWRQRYALIATAAAVLLVPSLNLYWTAQPQPQNPIRAHVVPEFPPPVLVEVKPAPEKMPPLRPQIEQARLGWTKWVDRLASANQHGRLIQTVSLPMEMSSVEALTGLEPLSRPLGHATHGAQHLSQGVAIGSQVISNTTQRALSYFSRKLPPMSAHPKPPL